MVVLLALAIVAFLAKDVLVKYLGPAATTRPASSSKAGTTPAEPAVSSAASPVDRARGLQDMMQKESEKRGGD